MKKIVIVLVFAVVGLVVGFYGMTVAHRMRHAFRRVSVPTPQAFVAMATDTHASWDGRIVIQTMAAKLQDKT